MSALPDGLRLVRRLDQGDVNDVWLTATPDGPMVLKRNAAPPPGLFAAEADGLERLRAAEALRIPAVVAQAEEFLLLEYLPPAAPGDPAAFARRFAEGLAAQHRLTADAFGLEIDNYLGTQLQPNAWTVRWPDFYRARRLLPQVERAKAAERLPAERERLVRAVLDRLDLFLEEMPDGPSLLHGDLWSGNFLCAAGGAPALIDPAVYFGPREMEIAFIELFGGFPPGFVDAYDEAFPLDPGYSRRRPLHHLYPLLIHLNHFGERYGPAVERVCRETLAGLP